MTTCSYSNRSSSNRAVAKNLTPPFKCLGTFPQSYQKEPRSRVLPFSDCRQLQPWSWRRPRGTSGSTPDRQLQDVASAVENLVLSKIRHAMPQCMTCSLAGCLYSPFSATLLLLNPSTMNSIIFYCWWIIDFLFFILVTESMVRSYK